MILAVTPGDPEGIGPEIVWKTLKERKVPRGARLLCVGAREPFERLGATVIDADPGKLAYPSHAQPFVWLLPAPVRMPRKKGKTLFLPGYQSGWSIETATQLALDGQVSALVTGPISKERLQRGGFLYPGHTEFLAELCRGKTTRRAPDVTMMLANDQLRITLATTHVALKDVPKHLTRAALKRAILHTAEHLEKWWGIRKPRIAVAALNPHAGEKGLFGKEEIRVIVPEIESIQRRYKGRFEISGPHPADTLFAKHISSDPNERYDAVVCMYHDQGLIPVKLLDFPRTVNITLGLPIVRTSVDHGVGFDLVGTGKADPSSFQAAIDSAIRISSHLRGLKQ